MFCILNTILNTIINTITSTITSMMQTPYITRLEDSRKTIFPAFIDSTEFKEIMIKQWTDTIINKDIVNNHQENQELPTLPVPIVMKAGKILLDKMLLLKKNDITVLEIMAGNCSGSRILFNTIKKGLNVKRWISTDIIDFTKKIKEEEIEFYKLNGLESIQNFSDGVDILLLMCPPPNKIIMNGHINPMALCDYYSIVEFCKLNIGKEKLLVLIGEIGASSATEGMYHFMLTCPQIKLLHREMLMTGKNQFGLIEMEIFIFLIL